MTTDDNDRKDAVGQPDGVDTESGDPSDTGTNESTLRSLAGNIGSLLTSTVFERAARFVLYASVARTLGAADLGRLALAVAIFQVISRFAVAGLPVLTTREVARDHRSASTYVANGGLIVTGTSLLGYLALFAFVTVVGYEAATTEVIWLLFVGLLPFCVSRILESVFIGLEKAQFITAVSVPVNLTQTVIALVLLQQGVGVWAVALSIGLAYLVIASILSIIALARRYVAVALPRTTIAWAMVKAGLPFLGIEGTLVLRASSNAVIISLVVGEAAVGIYSAASQLVIPLLLVGNTVGTGLFPMMVKAYRYGVAVLARAASRSVELTIAIVLPGVVGLAILGSDLITLIYDGEQFAESTDVLRLLAWSALAMAVASILGRALIAAQRETLTLRISVTNTTAQIAMSVLLTIQFGLLGAATAALMASVLNVVQHYIPVRRELGSFPIWSSLWRPAAASLTMAVVLLVIPDVQVLIAVLIGMAVYVCAFLLISMWAAGGFDNLKDEWKFSPAPDDHPA